MTIGSISFCPHGSGNRDMESVKKRKPALEDEEEETYSHTSLIPGLPDHLSLQCFAHLSNLDCATARATSRAWRATLSPSILNPIRKFSNLPPQQLLFLSLSTTDSISDVSWFLIDLLHRRCFTFPKPAIATSYCLLTGHVVSTYGHFFLPLLNHLDADPFMQLLRFSRKWFNLDSEALEQMTGSSSPVPVCHLVGDHSSVLKCEEWVYDTIPIPNRDSSTPLWSTWVGLGSCLFVAGGIANNHATSMAMSFNGKQWHKLAQLNEPRFMAKGLVFKGEVWVLGGKRFEDSGLKMVASGEVFVSMAQKWCVVQDMWPEHLQCLEEKVPCMVSAMGRMFALKMGSNMIVVWDEKRRGWDCLGLIGREYVEKGFKGRILGDYEKLWGVIEEPLMLFELETSLEKALTWASPSEEVVQTREIVGDLSWRRVDRELGLNLDGFHRILDCNLIEF